MVIMQNNLKQIDKCQLRWNMQSQRRQGSHLLESNNGFEILYAACKASNHEMQV